MGNGLEYTIVAANFFMEVWLSPVVGFDVPAGRVRIYGSGENAIGFVSYKDVAESAVRSLRDDRARNRTITVAGPANVPPIEVVRRFEQALGRSFSIEHVPEVAIRNQWLPVGDPLEKSFAALMLSYARGCIMDMHETLSVFPISLASVDDFVRIATNLERTRVVEN